MKQHQREPYVAAEMIVAFSFASRCSRSCVLRLGFLSAERLDSSELCESQVNRGTVRSLAYERMDT